MPAGSISWRMLATRAISAKLTLPDGTVHGAILDPDIRGIGLQQMRADALHLLCELRPARATAPPANTIEREAKVPKPNGAVAVSP